MGEIVNLDGQNYELSDLTARARDALNSIVFIDGKINELTRLKLALSKAKTGSLIEIKAEIMKQKSGFEFGSD
jgi:hypothetical protein